LPAWKTVIEHEPVAGVAALIVPVHCSPVSAVTVTLPVGTVGTLLPGELTESE
jgi:hypothetical protein